MIGQAFSGWLYLQGDADRDPAIAKPYTNDYVSAFATLFAALAGYTYAQKTGKGQVVDVAQFEAMAQYMCGTYTAYTMTGKVAERSGNFNPAFQPYNLFKSKDGRSGRLRPRRLQTLHPGHGSRCGVLQLQRLLFRPGGCRL